MNRREFLVASAALPVALAVDPIATAARFGGSAVALVTADLESHVVMLDLATARTLARLRTGPSPRSIEAVLGSTAVVAHTEHGVVSLVGVSPLAVRGELEGFASPRYTAAHPGLSPLAYVTDSTREEVVTVDVGSARIISRTQVPGPARHIAISTDGRTIWTVLGTAAVRIAVLDASNPHKPKLVRTIAPPFLAHDVVFAPDGRHVWVTSGSERQVALYRAGSRRPVRIVDADEPPQHVAFAGDRVFVASGDSGTIRRHRLDGELVRGVRVPVGSYNVSFGWRRLVTPSLGKGTISVLDPSGRVRAIRQVAKAAHDACVLAR
jgi:DNA-binding beta-propeller fold protein YncE